MSSADSYVLQAEANMESMADVVAEGLHKQEEKKKTENYIVKDSGNREQFSTGAVRDIQEGKGLPFLIPTTPLRRLAKHFENGAKKYGINNWKRGIPLSSYISSANRHIWSLMECDKEEDHAAALAWNAFCLIETIAMIEKGQLPKSLDDIGWFSDEEHTDSKK